MKGEENDKRGEHVSDLENEICHHFKKRCHERTGLGKKGRNRFIEKAKKYGLYDSDITNLKLKHFIKDKVDNCGNTRDFIIYNRYIIIFTKDVYITILHLPNAYCKIAYVLQQQKFERINNREGNYSERN
jgi:hypothetical protein